jgi:predicted dehydrogenase
MLGQERLDAVSIATRTRERAAIIQAAVAVGVRGIYCEKPLCNTLETADQLRALVEERGVAFVYGTKRRFMPIYRQVRALVRTGAIGVLQSITVQFGAGELFWLHPHSVDIASFFAGDDDIVSVQADLDLDAGSVHDCGRVVDADPQLRMGCIRFSSGVTAHIVASGGYDVELSGTAGKVAVRSDGRSAHWRTRLSEQDYGVLLDERIVPAHERSSGTENSVSVLCAAIRDGADPGYRIALAVRNQEVLFGFVYSHLTGGNRIPFPLERRGLTITGRSGCLYA